MASESSDGENSFVERLISSRNRDLSILFPLLLGMMGAPPATEAAAEGGGGGGEDSDGEADRIILINPFTQAMIVVEGGGGRSVEAIFREISESGNRAPPPASKSSIEAMPRVEALEEGEDCAICLEEMAAEAREMPCRHRYHSNCIEKWLGLHGSCPVCRFKMPVEEVQEAKKRGGGGGEEEGEEGGRRRRREIWVSFSVNRRDSSATTE